MKILLIILGSLGIMAQTATFNGIGLTAPPPPIVSGLSATRVGNAGNSTFYYWVVAKYTGGNSNPSPATIVQGAPNVLTVSNYIRLNWNVQANATGYDVLRTNDPRIPSGNCNCAVVTNTTATTVDDIGGVLSAYTIASASGVYTNCYIDNITVATPTINCAPIAWGGGGGAYTDGDGITIVGNEISLDTGYTNLLYPLLVSGLVPTNKLGSGTANATTFLRGDQTYAAIPTVRNIVYMGKLTSITAGATTFMVGGGNGATESQNRMTMPFACTARNLYVNASGSPADNNITFTLRKEAVDTALVATQTTGQTQVSDTVDTVALVAGDRISIKVVSTATGATTGNWNVSFECTL